MLTSVKYTAEPGVFAWPIPFAYAHASQVEARLVDETGLERALVQGADYQVSGSNVIYVLPPGCALVIYLNAPVAEAQAANNAAALMSLNQTAPAAPVAAVSETSQPAASPPDTDDQASRLAALESELASLRDERDQALLAARAAEQDSQIRAVADTGQQALALLADAREGAVQAVLDVQAEARGDLAAAELDARQAASEAEDTAARAEEAAQAADARTAETLAALERRIAELETRLNDVAAKREESLNRAARDGEAQVAAATRRALRDAEARGRLAGEAWPQTGHMEVREQYPAGTILPLPEPLRYYPGRNALHVHLNGLALIPGEDYGEVGTSLSNSWRPMRDLLVGDVLLFVIAPTNAGQAAALAARDAGKSAAAAQNHAASAGRHVNDCRGVLDDTRIQNVQAAGHAARAAQSLELCEEERRVAHAHAEEAARSAWEANVASARPGIAAVRNEDELSGVVEGMYIVNPHIRQTPTRFYGLWPVADVNEPILWDGLFFEGAAYEREPYAPPPPPVPCPCLPPDEDAPAAVPGGEWQPCDHVHRLCAHCRKD